MKKKLEMRLEEQRAASKKERLQSEKLTLDDEAVQSVRAIIETMRALAGGPAESGRSDPSVTSP